MKVRSTVLGPFFNLPALGIRIELDDLTNKEIGFLKLLEETIVGDCAVEFTVDRNYHEFLDITIVHKRK